MKPTTEILERIRKNSLANKEEAINEQNFFQTNRQGFNFPAVVRQVCSPCSQRSSSRPHRH